MSKHKHAEVIKAWADGEIIQCCMDSEWLDINYLDDLTPAFHSSLFQWRIKPKSVTIWVNVYPDLLISSHYATKEDADERADKSRIACVPVTYTEGEGL